MSDSFDMPLLHRAPATPHSSQYVWYVISLLTLVNAFNYMDRMALSVLLPPIQADLKISDAKLGLLTGFAFFIFYAIAGIPLAQWADRGIRRNVIAISLAVWSVMTALSGVVQNFWHLFVARIGVGAGEAGCLPAAQSLICDYVPLERRSGVFALHTFGLYAGMTLGMSLAGSLGEWIGWRWTFVVLGLPGIALALIVRFTTREAVRGALDGLNWGAAAHLTLTQAIAMLWRCASYRLILIFSVLNGFLEYGMSQWWPSFYVRIFGLSLSSAGTYLGVALGAGSAIGMLIGGVLSNQAVRLDVRRPLIVAAWAMALSLPTALASLFASSAFLSLALVLGTALFWSISFGPIIAIALSVVPPQARAVSGAFSTFATSVIGFGLGPFCVGALSDLLTPSLNAQALRYALIAPNCLVPAMVVVLYAAAKTLPNDLQATGSQKMPVRTSSVLS